MKNSIIPLLFIFIIFSSCGKEKIKEVSQMNKIVHYDQESLSNFIQETGVLELQLKGVTWKEMHENYLENLEKFKDHPNLITYKQHVIHYQIKNTSILDGITSEKVKILKDYLSILELSHFAYPEINYKILKSLGQDIETEELMRLSKISFNKGIKEQLERKILVDKVDKSNELEEVKNSYKNSYQKNYEIYLPKLKEFFTAD